MAQLENLKKGIVVSATEASEISIGIVKLNFLVSLCTSRSEFVSVQAARDPRLVEEACGTSLVTAFAVRMATAQGTLGRCAKKKTYYILVGVGCRYLGIYEHEHEINSSRYTSLSDKESKNL